MTDSNGFYFTFRSRAPNSFKISHTLRHSLYLKGWKMALISVRLPPHVNKDTGYITLSCSASFPKLKSHRADVTKAESFDVVTKNFYQHGKAANSTYGVVVNLLRKVRRQLSKDYTNLAGVKIRQVEYTNEEIAQRGGEIEAGGLPLTDSETEDDDDGGDEEEAKLHTQVAKAFVLVHNNKVAPQISLTFNHMFSEALGLPPSNSYYNVSAKMKTLQERTADAIVEARKSALDEFLQGGNEEKQFKFDAKTATLNIKPEGADEKIIFMNDQLVPMEKLFHTPANVRIKCNLQKLVMDAITEDATARIGQLIPYARMDKESESVYYEVPHPRYYPVTDVEFGIVELRILTEDGNIINHPHDMRIQHKVEVTYHFIPPENLPNEEAEIYPITYTAYAEMMKRNAVAAMGASASDLSDLTASFSSQPSSTASSSAKNTNMLRVSQGAGFNKPSMSNKASTSAGFGN